ncbi:type III effector protein [Ralstonia solanacearum]|uniref:type III effector protein n=1 Tax=Ralstonia solanacearum TaxID=305 RepID=UPI001B3B3C67|nr:type III effector protein [Ralstonia solanacearum]AST33665.2 type III effector protein [Ralstonia solanacearum]MDB0510436.1 type III effector protein [Ralstonia solanacearum]MDB0514941.1 type III effector protein [Ralstonia solanacearum]
MKRIDVHAIPEPAREPIEAPAPAPDPAAPVPQPTDTTLALLEAAVRRLLQEVNGSLVPARRHVKKRRRISQTEVAVLVLVRERKNANGHSEWVVERVRLGERALGVDVLGNSGEFTTQGNFDIGPPQGGASAGAVGVVVEQYASHTTVADTATATATARPA